MLSTKYEPHKRRVSAWWTYTLFRSMYYFFLEYTFPFLSGASQWWCWWVSSCIQGWRLGYLICRRTLRGTPAIAEPGPCKGIGSGGVGREGAVVLIVCISHHCDFKSSSKARVNTRNVKLGVKANTVIKHKISLKMHPESAWEIQWEDEQS